jgi:hypothetical protein
VTGAKPHVPYGAEPLTLEDASCSVVVFCATKHAKVECRELMDGVFGVQPAAAANSL